MPIQIDEIQVDLSGEPARGADTTAASSAPAASTVSLAEQLRALLAAEQRRAERLAAE